MLNSTDSISIYDGDIYNKPSLHLVAELRHDSPLEKRFLTTRGPSLSVRVVASGASESYGFIAEVVTTPISAIGFSKYLLRPNLFALLAIGNWTYFQKILLSTAVLETGGTHPILFIPSGVCHLIRREDDWRLMLHSYFGVLGGISHWSKVGVLL